MPNIKIISLISGESLVGEVLTKRKSKSRQITIKDPLRIMNDFNPETGKHHTFLIRWLPQSSERIYKFKTSILSTDPKEPSNQIENYYYDTIDEIFGPDEDEEVSFNKDMRRIQLKLLLEQPTREEEIN